MHRRDSERVVHPFIDAVDEFLQPTIVLFDADQPDVQHGDGCRPVGRGYNLDGLVHDLDALLRLVVGQDGRLIDMTITVEVDEATLEAAQRALGTTDQASTVAEALNRAVASDRRRQALNREFGPERAEQYALLEDRDALWR
jgi:Arc/MetJ family transcription regulator